MKTYGYHNPGEEYPQPYRSEKKLAAGIFAILLGALGVHKFYLGYSTEGAILLISSLIILPLFTLLTCGLGATIYPVVFIVPIVEGVIYLTMDARKFDETYVRNNRPWF